MKASPKLISTAIMKTDIKGFSRKIGILSDMELSKLLQDHKEFIIRSVYKYDGSIIKGEGDAFLISFSSVTSAIEAAINIQNKLLELREGTDDNSRLSVRIVITLGDVLHKDDDVFGESVNFIECGDSGGSDESGGSSESGQSGESGESEDPGESDDQKIYGLYSVKCHTVEKRSGWVGFGSGGSGWLLGQQSVGPWIVGVINFQKIFGLYGPKYYTTEER